MLVRFAARDPGAANVLAALVSEMDLPSKVAQDAWVMPRASRLREAVPGPVREFAGMPALDTLAAAWNEGPADVLITGTSHYEPFDQCLWDVARRRGAPSLAVLDQWMNTAQRFMHGRPDYVGVLDETQAQQLRDAGFGSEQLLVVGHPWLAHVALSQRRPELPRHTDGVTRVLFASEPVRSDVDLGFNAPFGYDEFESFSVVHEAGIVAATGGRRVEIAIKCHPYEDADAFRRRLETLPRVDRLSVTFADHSRGALEWVRWADLITGISSMLLLEAMVLGRAVISVQPGLIREETFAPSARGAAVTVTAHATGVDTIAELIVDATRRSREIVRHAPFVRQATVDGRSVVRHWISGQLGLSN